MINRKIFFVFTFVFSCFQTFSQEKFEINSTLWEFELPENFVRNDVVESSEFEGDSAFFLEVSKPNSPEMNIMSVTTYSNFNLKSMTAGVYANSLLNSMKNNFRNENLQADVYLDKLKIDGISFFVIHSDVLDPHNEERFMASVYIAEIDDREFNLMILYDNDEDGFALENTLLNSKFIQP